MPKSMWIKNLHIKQDTLNLIEDKVGKSLEHICSDEIFLNRTQTTQALRPTIDKRDLINLKCFHKARDSVNGTKGPPPDWKISLPILCQKMDNIQYIQKPREFRLH